MDTQLVTIKVTPEMHEAIKRHAAQRGATQSGLIRAVMGEWLAAQGDPVDWVVPWGGRRDKPDVPSE